MSQITLPWIERSPEKLASYRRKAVTRLLGLGFVSLAVALVATFLHRLADVSFAIDPFNPDALSDAKIIPFFILCLGAGLGGLTFLAAGLAVASYEGIGRILKAPYVAFVIFLSALVGVCLIVWLHAFVFSLVEVAAASNAGAPAHTIPVLGIEYPLSSSQIYEAMRNTPLGIPFMESARLSIPPVAYLLWPLQFVLVRDVVALAGIIGFISIIPAFGIWWERKVAGRIQSRMGPMRTGGWHGWAQSAADGIKLVFKEDFIPSGGDRLLFKLAVYIVFIPPLLAFIALPFAGAWVFRDLDVALLFILAMLGIEVLGVILAGWASNNKWSVYGAMREACQMVSYEIPMGMSLLIPVMMAGSLQLTTITDMQAGGFWNWFVFANPWCFIAFFVYYTAALASCKRAPFDLPESESELVAGFLTEYSGMRWSLFFFGEYVAMFVVSGLAVILFLGGWKSPVPEAWVESLVLQMGVAENMIGTVIRGVLKEGPILFLLKAAFLYYVQLWIRWTLPRIRIDQVLYACVQVLLPLTMVVLLANTLWILGVEHLKLGWLVAVDAALHWILVAIGVVVTLAMLGIAAFGYKNNRRLVGSMAAQQLPGA
ncbi:MAG: NADH-quinone oxidoreductase subunit NuoH [Phycisphaerae bacterium]|nr:NADH-quinone oxidoreductase subunit NuoH [Phycisphaerae bacterium]